MIKVAVLGYGTVGSGVVDVIYDNAAIIEKNAGGPIEVSYILDIQDYPDSPYANKIVHDFAIIENDPEIRVVVETIGGLKPAYDFTQRGHLKQRTCCNAWCGAACHRERE